MIVYMYNAAHMLFSVCDINFQDTLVYVRSLMPSQSFSEMIEILKKLVSFMNMTVSVCFHVYVCIYNSI